MSLQQWVVVFFLGGRAPTGSRTEAAQLACKTAAQGQQGAGNMKQNASKLCTWVVPIRILWLKILVSFKLSISIPAEQIEIGSGLSFFAPFQFTVCNENVLHSFKTQVTAVIYLKETRWKGTDWIHLGQNEEQWHTLLNVVTKYQLLKAFATWRR